MDLTPTPSSTATPSAGPSLSATPPPVDEGKLELVQALAEPNPYKGGVSAGIQVLLSGRADSFHVRFYSSGFTRISELSLAGAGPGWDHLGLPPDALPKSNGLFFAQVWAEGSGQKSNVMRLRLYILR